MEIVQEISYLEVEYIVSAQYPHLSNYPSQVQESKVHCKLVHVIYGCSKEAIIVFKVLLIFVMHISELHIELD